MKKPNTMLLLITVETFGLFLLGSLGSKFSSYINFSPAIIVTISAICILLVSLLSFRRLEPSEQLRPSYPVRRQVFDLRVPRTMLGTIPFGIFLGLLVAIPSTILFPTKIRLIAPCPFPIAVYSEITKIPVQEVETSMLIVLNKYELISTIILICIALLCAVFIGSHRAAALAGGWAIGTSVAVCLLKPKENLIFFTFTGNGFIALILGWILIRLRTQILHLRDELQALRD